jgi:hypothetical protein
VTDGKVDIGYTRLSATNTNLDIVSSLTAIGHRISLAYILSVFSRFYDALRLIMVRARIGIKLEDKGNKKWLSRFQVQCTEAHLQEGSIFGGSRMRNQDQL